MSHIYASPAEELSALLGEEIGEAKRRESTTFDSLVSSEADSIVLFGAGGLGRKVLGGLVRTGFKVVAFADNNSRLWGKTVEGIPVYSPLEAAQKFGNSCKFIVTIWRGRATETMKERCRTLTELGCRGVIHFGALFWKCPEIFLPHYSLDLPHKVLENAECVRRAFGLWGDEASRKEFVAQIRWRLHLDFDGLPGPVAHEIYFPDDLVKLSPEEQFVDCGAFDGDTLESFLRVSQGRFGRFFAFEADPGNFKKLQENVARLPADRNSKIKVFPLAVGKGSGKVRFDPTGTEASAVGQGSLEIDGDCLDATLKGSTPTWIKMDIEGSEPDAIDGAKDIIAKNCPVLAICVYHLQDHVWSIPLQISRLSDQYSFFLRPHLFESWDLVCYAVPRERLLMDKAREL